MKIILLISIFASASIWKEKVTPPPRPLTDREKVIAAAAADIGIKEKTGRNDGDVEKYIASVGLNPKAHYPYCVAAIYHWGKVALGSNNPYPKSAWSPDFGKGGKRVTQGLVIRPADVFTTYDHRRKRISHGGLCRGTTPTHLITIEANTSNTAALGSEEDREASKGGGVYSKRRPLKSLYKIRSWF